jgi:protein-S-isoprenylcysteine O-methyltransferase Ste14
MTTPELHTLANVSLAVCWAAFGLTWVIGAFYSGSRQPAERAVTPFTSVFLIGGVIIWIVFRVTPLSAWDSLVAQAQWVRFLGLAILLSGTAFTLWARFVLGVMWSAAPTVKQEHQLRTGGPYALTRHPIYTGILAMLLGSSLLLGVGRWVVIFPIYLVLFEIKIRIEERLMLATFPDDYPSYRRRVPQLVPGLRRIRRQDGS